MMAPADMPFHPLLRLQTSIESAVKILEDQYEAVEQTKSEVEQLKKGKLSESEAKPFPAGIHVQCGCLF